MISVTTSVPPAIRNERSMVSAKSSQTCATHCSVKPELMQVLRAYGLINTIGKENVFETGFGVFTSAKRALDRAKKIVGHSIDTSEVDVEEENLSYEI